MVTELLKMKTVYDCVVREDDCDFMSTELTNIMTLLMERF